MKGILINPDGWDLLIENKALVIGVGTSQVAEHVIRANRGEFKEFPLIGAEVDKLKNGIKDPMWSATTRDMLNTCGVPVERVIVAGDKITLE